MNGPALYTPPICAIRSAHAVACSALVSAAVTRSGGVRHSCECRWLHRDRLRWKRPLAQDVALGHRTLFDSENRPASLTVQDVEVARLRCESKRRNPASVLHDVEQSGRRWWIVIPQIVMDRLEVPFALSSLNIDRHDRVSEEVAPSGRRRRRLESVRKEAGTPDRATRRRWKKRLHHAGSRPFQLLPSRCRARRLQAEHAAEPHGLTPVRASNARALPMPPLAPGGVLAPTTITFLKMPGTSRTALQYQSLRFVRRRGRRAGFLRRARSSAGLP